MFLPLKRTFAKSLSALSHRELFLRSSFLSLAGLLPARGASATPEQSGGLRIGPGIYESIGARPLINCRGTLTVIGGSAEIEEVRAAKDAAAQHCVQLDELADAIAKRLAELTGAEWGMVSSGCAAGLAHVTAACVAGGNPELHVKIPDLRGFPKDEVVIPRASRTQYDHSVRMIGVKVFEVSTLEEFHAALGPKTAMIYMKTDPRPPSDPLQLEVVAKIAKSKGVPVLADAAAEILTIPNVHLQKGVDVVGYSGGKVLRGPQCAGLMLGRKDLLQAAWMHGAPHHGFGRAMKVGKEEALGMLAAVESWVKRDHEAEWQQYLDRLDHIVRRVSTVPTVTTSVRNQPERLGNRSPRLTVNWDATRLNISGEEVAQHLWAGNPRIALRGGSRPGAERPADANQTSVSITAFMMLPGEERIVADRLYDVLSATRPAKPAIAPQPPVTDMTGRWDVTIDFSASSSSNHVFHIEQRDGKLEGSHQGDVFTRDFNGSIDCDRVEIRSVYNEGHGDSIPYTFTGNISGDSIAGSLDMGEYLSATWSARRHGYGRRSHRSERV